MWMIRCIRSGKVQQYQRYGFLHNANWNDKMTIRYGTTLQILALTTALGTAPAMAQDATADEVSVDLLLELAANDAVEDVLNLPGAELAAILAGASDAQMAQLVNALSPAQVDSLVAKVAQSGTDAENVARVVAAVITAAPESAARVVDVVRANTPPVDLPKIADAMVDQVERGLADLPPEVSSALVTATVSLDAGSAGRLVEVADRQGDQGDTIIQQLATISESADPAVAEAIESAVLQSDRASQVFADARGEVAPAALAPAALAPEPAVETPPSPVPPAEIGGAGATPGGTPANASGSPTQVASTSPSTGGGTPSTGGGTGGSGGGAVTPPSPPPPVSPTD